MSTAQWIGCVGFPFVGALHRYAVSYGYRGLEKREAQQEAVRVFVMLSIISACYVVVATS